MDHWKQRAVPVARSDGLLIEPVGDETVIYDTESKQAHCLAPLAAIVFDCSDGRATVAEMAQAAQRRLGRPVSEDDAANAVSQLERAGLLQAALVIHTADHLGARSGNGHSRRDVIRRIGFAGATAAIGTSLITTIFPAAALAQCGLPVGCAGCTKNQDCVPPPKQPAGHCCQSVPGKQCNQGCCVGADNSCHTVNCSCSISGTPCNGTTVCGTGQGTCHCTCTVCSGEPECGGVCPCNGVTCPTSSCCSICAAGT